MKKINSYIFEKLHLTKDNKNLKNTVVSIMTDICCLNLDQSMIKDILKSFEDWVRKNEIESIEEVECLINDKLYMDKHIWAAIKKKKLDKFVTITDEDVIKNYYRNYITSPNWYKYIKARLSEETTSLGSTFETDNNEFIYYSNFTSVIVIVFRKKDN